MEVRHTCEETGSPHKQMETELIGQVVGGGASEDGMGTPLVRAWGAVLFPLGTAKAAGRSRGWGGRGIGACTYKMEYRNAVLFRK